MSSGGTLETTSISKGAGTAQINFDDAILRAAASNAAFINGFASSELNIAAGGLTIDTAGSSIGALAFGGVGGLTVTGNGTFALGGLNTYTGQTVIDSGSTLALELDGDIAASSGLHNNGVFDITSIAAGTSIKTLSGSGVVDIGTNTLTLTSALDTFSGAFQGSGGLTLASGNETLTGDSSGFTGTTTVQGGTLSVNGLLGGTMNVTGGRLQGIGSVGDTTLSAASIIAPGNSIGTLTVAGNYIGNGNTLEIESVLGGDASPSDRLVVTGNTSGSTNVQVINLGGAGGPTTNGIKIVDVGGASNGTFALLGNYVFHGQQAVIGGAYAYTLQKNGVTTPADGDWYLRSSLVNPPPDITGPLYQPGVPSYEAYPQVLLAMNNLPTLRQRVGNRYWDGDATIAAAGDQPAQERSVFWGRTEGSYSSSTAAGSTYSDFNMGQWSARTGFDGLLYRNDDGMVVGGLTAHYGLGAADIRSVYGDSHINTSARGIGGTLTWYGATGFYVDSQAQVTIFDSTLKSDLLGRDMARDNGGLGYAFSVETGKRFGLNGPWTLTPQAQLIYSAVQTDFIDNFGTKISLDGNERVTGRLGAALDHQRMWRDDAGKLARANLYGVASVYYEFVGGSVNVAGVNFASGTERVAGGFGLGGTYNWDNDKYSVFGEALIKTAFAEDYSIGGTAGFRMKW